MALFNTSGSDLIFGPDSTDEDNYSKDVNDLKDADDIFKKDMFFVILLLV